MKRENMLSNVIYVQCPDRTCSLWYDKEIQCEYDCPKKDELQKSIKCGLCGKVIVLSSDFSRLQRVEHLNEDGSNHIIFKKQTLIIRGDKI